MQDYIHYFIIDRIKGVTYDPYFCGTGYLLAYSNKATDTKGFVINKAKLNKGLAEKRYRLVLKSSL